VLINATDNGHTILKMQAKFIDFRGHISTSLRYEKRCKIWVQSRSISSNTVYDILHQSCCLPKSCSARLMIGPSWFAQRKGACSSTGCQHSAGHAHLALCAMHAVVYIVHKEKDPLSYPPRAPVQQEKEASCKKCYAHETWRTHLFIVSSLARIILIREKKTTAQYAYETSRTQKRT
jgi:hypothetical protein